jgi:ubiquinone/menaquinone biosynthesis C-methylase UbiE
MSTDNSEQIADWNGAMGRLWAENQREIDAVVVPFGAAALAAAAPQAGAHVIDVGCGCGDTSIEIARVVGERGNVLGVDVSQPMLEVARARASRAGCTNLVFREADASAAQLPTGIDLLFSRFGVMFFSQPSPAFRHLRASLRAGGRCVFVCWRAPRDNAWAMAPLAAARAAMGVTPPPADPNAPGPFAFADEARVRSLLTEAGFAGVEFRRFDQMLSLGESPHDAAEYAMRIGPTSRFAREMGDEHLPAIRKAVEQAFAQLAAPDGRVNLVGSAWIVSATNPA